MDIDFWTTRAHTVKHLSAARLNYDDHSFLENSEGDDDGRPYFPCPFCYVEVELSVFCSHLQEEHCFGLKNAVCPLCAANLGKEPIEHFTLQHAHSIKRQKSQRSAFWTNNPSGISKEFRGLSSFLGSSSKIDRGNARESSTDPLLSPFLCFTPLSDSHNNQKDELLSNNVAVASDVKRTMPSTFNESQQQDQERKRQRAEFVQELMLSTIFEDS